MKKKAKKKMKNKKDAKNNKLILIPKTEKYIEYILQIILKLPRTEKFNIGNEYKISMYQMLKDILRISKSEKSEICFTKRKQRHC